MVRQGVHVRDVEPTADDPGRPGIIAALKRLQDGGATRYPSVDAPVAKALTRAMEEAGIRPSQRQRQVGDFVLTRLLFEGPGYQDWEATHTSLTRVTRRIRIYSVATKATAESRQTLARAAQREFQILEGIQHPGILRALAYHEHERGPALVFEHEPKAVRLDHFLIEHGHRLDVDLRLGLLRQIAEALQYAHEKKLVHRALSPQSVLVLNPQAPVPRVQLFNWQTAARDFGTTSSRGVTATQHVGDLVETASTPYMAPEALTDPQSRGEQLDVFGLGAIAYHLFAGTPPASSFAGAEREAPRGQGPSDRIGAERRRREPSLSHPVQHASEVTSRLDSVTDFLSLLEKVEDELTAPPGGPGCCAIPSRPRWATAWRAATSSRKRLGKGSTAVVFLVEKDGREQVLKLALDPEHNERLLDEGEVLRKLRHQHIVELHGHGDRSVSAPVFSWTKAGDETLAQRLRAEGRLHVDLLQRFGEDLLQAAAVARAPGHPAPRHQARQHRDRADRALGPPAPRALRLLPLADAGRAHPRRHRAVPRPLPVAPEAAALGPPRRALRRGHDAPRDGDGHASALGRRQERSRRAGLRGHARR